MADKPNILFIFSDQHRGDTLGCAGHPVVITPNMDRLSSEGVTFERCSTNSPLCMPARASMMMGQYVCRHGVWTNNVEADPKGPSHVRNIRDAGYHTAVIGKTHLYQHRFGKSKHHTKDKIHILNDWGFEDTHEVHGPIASTFNDSPYTDYLAEKGLLKAHRDYMGDYASKFMTGKNRPWEEPPCPLPDEAHLDSYVGSNAIEWIQNYKGDKPFYLQVNFPGPHDPFDSTEKHRARYNPGDVPVGNMELPSEPVPPYVQGVLRWSGINGIITGEDKQLMSTFYYGKISLIDEYIGRIIKSLEENGLLDNTWIIYSSDHGEMLGDHQMSHKIVFYEGALRIPCIIRPPAGMAGWKSAALTDQIDLTVTMADIAGAEPLTGCEGRSLVQKVQAGPDDPDSQKGKDSVFSEVYGFSMVRDDRFKLAINTGTSEPVEMFDLKDDPDENRNLVFDPSYEDIRKDLKEKLLDMLNNHLDKEKYGTFQDVESKSALSLTNLK